MNFLRSLTGMKPVAYGSYFVQMLTNSVRLYFAMGKSKWYVWPRKASMTMAMKRFTNTCDTRIMNTTKKAIDIGEPQAKGSPPFAIIVS